MNSRGVGTDYQIQSTMNRAKANMDSLHMKSVNKLKGDGVDHWQEVAKQGHRFRSKLVILFILYLFTQDDQKISHGEKKGIRQFLKHEKHTFTDDDIHDVEKLMETYPTIDYVVHYLHSQNVNEFVFKQILSITTDSVPNKPQYQVLLTKLKDTYMQSLHKTK